MVRAFRPSNRLGGNGAWGDRGVEGHQVDSITTEGDPALPQPVGGFDL
jgi:hypothetical protein